MKIRNLLFLALSGMPFISHAGQGPVSIGAVSIGMSKADYNAALSINPVNCNIQKGKRSEMKYLDSANKTLCFGFSFRKTGSSENIQVSGISYDAIEANYDSSKFVKSVGNSSKAIFLDDRLVSLEITFPKVKLKTLTSKYGAPKLIDNRSVKVCKNRMGNEFENSIGNLDAAWDNGSVRTVLRTETSPPRKTCTDGITMQYYILEEPDKIKIIEGAISTYQEGLSKKEASESPF